VLYKQLETSSRGKTLTTTRLRRDHPNVERILGQMLLDPDGRPLVSGDGADDEDEDDDDALDSPYETHVPRVLGAHAWPPDMRE
jgi:hypothetical protein